MLFSDKSFPSNSVTYVSFQKRVFLSNIVHLVMHSFLFNMFKQHIDLMCENKINFKFKTKKKKKINSMFMSHHRWVCLWLGHRLFYVFIWGKGRRWWEKGQVRVHVEEIWREGKDQGSLEVTEGGSEAFPGSCLSFWCLYLLRRKSWNVSSVPSILRRQIISNWV